MGSLKSKNHKFKTKSNLENGVRVVKDVTDAILARAGQFIKCTWPVTPDTRAAINNGLYQQVRFSNAIGCIDYTHVRITVSC